MDKNKIYDLEALTNKLDFGISAIGIVQNAVAEEVFVDSSEIGKALFCIYDYMKTVNDAAKETIASMITQSKKEGNTL